MNAARLNEAYASPLRKTIWDQIGSRMQRKARDVAAYIQEAPAERREHLSKLRALCLEVLTGHEAVMGYGLLILRTELEDRALRAELPGYRRTQPKSATG